MGDCRIKLRLGPSWGCEIPFFRWTTAEVSYWFCMIIYHINSYHDFISYIQSFSGRHSPRINVRQRFFETAIQSISTLHGLRVIKRGKGHFSMDRRFSHHTKPPWLVREFTNHVNVVDYQKGKSHPNDIHMISHYIYITIFRG